MAKGIPGQHEFYKNAEPKRPWMKDQPEVTQEGEETPETFVFNPEIHTIAHKGGGRYYVLNGEEKVYGPMDKASAEAMAASAEQPEG